MVSGCKYEATVVTVLLSVYSQVSVSCVDTAAVESYCGFILVSLQPDSDWEEKDCGGQVKPFPV